jgi:pimeloyl-ACP methyl ester carboxylesterase
MHTLSDLQGAAIGQLAALDFPDRVASLTLVASTPGGPGHENPDLPGISATLRAFFESIKEPDWSDRAAVVEYLVEAERPFAVVRASSMKRPCETLRSVSFAARLTLLPK